MSKMPKITIGEEGDGYSYAIPGPAGTMLASGWRIYKTQGRCLAAVKRLHRRLTNGYAWVVELPYDWKRRMQPPDIYLSF